MEILHKEVDQSFELHFHVYLIVRVGRNVAAGMTGGLAYILDEDDTLIPKVCATNICSVDNLQHLYLCAYIDTHSLSLGWVICCIHNSSSIPSYPASLS